MSILGKRPFEVALAMMSVAALAFAATFVTFSASKESVYRFKDSRCLKALNRTIAAISTPMRTLSINFNLTRPVFNAKVSWWWEYEHRIIDIFQVDFSTKHKSFSMSHYATVINTTIDACGFMNCTANDVIAKIFIDVLVNKLHKKYIHACPYYGYHSVSNISHEVHKVAARTFPKWPNILRSLWWERWKFILSWSELRFV